MKVLLVLHTFIYNSDFVQKLTKISDWSKRSAKAKSFRSQVAHGAGAYLRFLLCYADESL